MFKNSGYTVVIASRYNTYMPALFQSPLIGCLSRSRPHMDVTVHCHRAVIVLATSMAGINFCKRRKLLIVGIPILASGPWLVGKMVGNADYVLTFIVLYQLLVTHGMTLLPVILQKEHIVVAIQSCALPFISHKHRKAFFFCSFRQRSDLLPVLCDGLIVVAILYLYAKFRRPHIKWIIGNRPKIHGLLYLFIPHIQPFHLVMMDVAVHICPKFFIFHGTLLIRFNLGRPQHLLSALHPAPLFRRLFPGCFRCNHNSRLLRMLCFSPSF